MLLDKRNTTNCRLMWDCEFYLRLIKGLIGFNNSVVSAMLSSVVTRECTVFIKEAMSFEKSLEKAVRKGSSKLFKSSFPIIRDKIHYFPSQPFSYEVEKGIYATVVGEIQQRFRTRPKDDMYHLKNDLSYVKSNGLIYCSSIDMYALTFGTAIMKDGSIHGRANKQYSQDLSSLISSIQKGFSSTDAGKIIHLQDLSPKHNLDVVFYNGKFDVAVDAIGCSDFITTLALRLLNDTGTIRFIAETGFNDNWSDTNMLYFIVRLIAIRFDEISDALYRIENDFPNEEASAFIKLLKDNDILPFPDKIREVAKRLRNSIHYNHQNEIWSIDLSKTFYWYECFLKQASTRKYTFNVWPDDFISLKNEMIKYLNKLQELLSSIFDYKLEEEV
jgi:hypothetical protein